MVKVPGVDGSEASGPALTDTVADGVTEQACTGDALLCGAGADAAKSCRLLSVSAQPPLALMAAVVLLKVAAALPPSLQLAVPNPTRSTALPPERQLPLKAVVLLTSASFPLVPLRAMLPVASGAGRSVVPPLPCASCTK